MAKVFLLNPPHPEAKGFTREGRCTQETGVWATQWPPISLATTAAFLEKDGHRITVMDCPAVGLDMAALEAMIKKAQPDFVFWNTATPTLTFDLKIAKPIKEAAPHAVTGVLGTHVTALPEIALGNPFIDMVIRKEPEMTIKELCQDKDRGWETIPGLSYRGKRKNKIHHNRDRDLLLPEDIPSPAWHLLNITPYRLPLQGRAFLIVAPIRGCPFPCSFCAAPIYYGKKLRKRPVKDVVDEIEDNMKRFGVRDFFIWADTFTAEKGYVKRFCQEIISRDMEISWTCNSRVDTIDRETLELMKRAGLWMISFGIESGSMEILKLSKKNITVHQIKKAVTTAHDSGVRTSGHFILGLPGETEESMQETLSLSLDLPLDLAQFYAAAPFPGTELHEQALKKGWLRTDFNFSQTYAVMDLPGLPARRVDRFRRYAYRRFYMRPRILINLLSMVEWGGIRDIFGNLRNFFQWAR